MVQRDPSTGAAQDRSVESRLPRADRAKQPGRARAVAVTLLLVGGFGLRLWTADAQWRWFDGEFPGAWERSHVLLSQDATQYVRQAEPGSPLGRWQAQPYYRPPLASFYFVALFRTLGFSRLAVCGVQALLALAGAFLVFRLASRALGFRAALLGLVATLLHPVLVFFDVSFEDSVPAFVCLALALGLFPSSEQDSRWRALAAGAALGASLLARPNLAVVAVALALALAARRSRWRVLPAFVAPVVLLVALPTLHNYRASGRLALVTDTNGENLYWGNAAPEEERILLQGFWDIRQVDVDSPGWLLLQDLVARHRTRALDVAFREEALDYARSHPAAVTLGLARKALRHLAADEIPRNENFAVLRVSAPLLRWPYPPYAVVACLALAGAVGLGRGGREPALLLLAPGLAMLVTEVLYFNASRYRSLGLPFLMPLAALALLRAFDAARVRRWRGVALLLVVVVASWLLGERIVSPLERRQHLSASVFKFAMLEAYADERGRLRLADEARFEARLSAALALEPRNLDARVMLVKSLTATGRRDEAAAVRDEGCRQCRPGDRLCALCCESLAGSPRRAP